MRPQLILLPLKPCPKNTKNEDPAPARPALLRVHLVPPFAGKDIWISLIAQVACRELVSLTFGK